MLANWLCVDYVVFFFPLCYLANKGIRRAVVVCSTCMIIAAIFR